MKRSEEQSGTTKLRFHKSLQTLAQGPRHLHCVLAALITFLSFGPRAQAQCPTVTPHTASGSAKRGKIGINCNTCPDHYYLARGSGDGMEFSYYSCGPLSSGNWHVDDWTYSQITGSWVAIDPERFGNSNGDPRTRLPECDGCSHDGYSTSTNGVWEREDRDTLWTMVHFDSHKHGSCVDGTCQGTSSMFDHDDGSTVTGAFGSADPLPPDMPTWPTTQRTETSCTYSQTVTEKNYSYNGNGWTTTGKAFNWSGVWLSAEYTTTRLEGLVKGLAEERLPAGFPSGGPNNQTPAATATISAEEDCATASSSRWKAQVTGTVQNERYEVVYRRAEFSTSRGWTNSWVKKLVTAPGSTWWYPSDAGEVLNVPSWEPGICPSTWGEHLVYLLDFDISLATATDSPPGTGGPGGAGGGGGGGCSTCAGNRGDSFFSGASFHVSTGNAKGGKAGELYFLTSQPSVAMATPAFLSFSGVTEPGAGIEVVRDTTTGVMLQIVTPQAFTVVSPLTYAYDIKVYRPAAKGDWTGQSYDLSNPSANLLTTWHIENPGGAASFNTLSITETPAGGNQRIWQYSYDSGTGVWTLSLPDSLGQNRFSQVTDPTTGTRTETAQVLSPGASLLFQHTKVFEKRSWGEALTAETIGAGSDAQTTAYDFYDPAQLPFTASTSLPPLKEVRHPDGSWERCATYDNLGRRVLVLSGIDSAPTSNTAVCRATTYDYTPVASGDDGTVEPNSPRKVTEAFKNNIVSLTYCVIKPGERRELRCLDTAATYTQAAGDPNTLTRLTVTDVTTGRSVRTDHDDGTWTLYTHTEDTQAGTLTDTVSTGQPNVPGTSIDVGTQTVTVTGNLGQMRSRTVKNISGGAAVVVLSSETYDIYDEFERPQKTTYLDGTYEERYYNCCGLDHQVDREGVLTEFFYDALKRQTSSRRNSLTMGKDYDGAGNAIVAWRQPDGGARTTLFSYLYDTADRLYNETNPLGGVTTHQETMDPATCRRTRTHTNPDTGTRVELFSSDGLLLKLTGSAAQAVRSVSGFEQTVDSETGTHSYAFTQEIKLNSDGSDSGEWIKTYADALGRVTKILYADAAYSLSFYNTKGQLWRERDPDNVITAYTYNSVGAREYTIVAALAATRALDYLTLSNNLANNLMGTTGDRISRIQRLVVAGTPDLVRVDTFGWKDGQSAGSLLSRTETSTGGNQAWRTAWRQAGNDATKATTQSMSTCDRNNRTRTDTVTAPDGTQTVSFYQDGRLASVTRKDSTANHNTVSSTAYAYSSSGQQYITTDSRNGTTTYTFNNSDQVTSTTTPDAGGGSQVTITYYDTLGRATGMRYPDATTVTNFYSPAGLLTKTYGSRTYPVEYTYDAQGRMSTMKTWQSFATSGATTTWNYDSYRGWLKFKDYPDKGTGNPPATAGTSGPQYTYTGAGRLRTRNWLRLGTSNNRIVTTYTYGFDQTGTKHGDLIGVGYNNDPASTPSISYTYDRLGQRSQVVQNGQNSITTILSYNDANQPLSESYNNGLLAGLSVGSTFNNSLQRTALSLTGISGTYSVSYGYDTTGRLHTVTSGANVATYGYLANSPLVSQIGFASSGTTRMTTTKQYDRLNRLQAISSVSPVQSVAGFGYLYNSANQRTRTTLADDSYWLYTYDSLGQVISGKRFWQDGTPVAGQQYEYGFDDIGNRKSASMGGDANGSPLRQARYDTPYPPNRLNQYVQRDVPAVVDIMGIANPTASVKVNNNTAYRKGEYFDYALSTPNASTLWYSTVTVQSTYGAGQTETGTLFVPKTQEQFTYDDDGNLTQDGRWTYVWDGENRLIKMASANPSVGPQQSFKFEYDWQGRRINKQVWSNATWNGSPAADVKFLYDGWNLLAELNTANNAVIRSFVWGRDLSGSPQGAGGVGGLLQVAYTGAQTTNCFVAFGGNGNVAALADAASTNIFAQYEYGPFGEVIRATGLMAKANPFRFSTKYQDDETDLLYYGYRYYNASTGRWLSRDPIAEKGGLNLCGFVGNDPIRRNDYLGLEALCYYDDRGVWTCRSPLEGCCNGQTYLYATHCCCKGKIVAKAPVDTGVQTWKWVSSVGNPANPGGAPDMHWWLTWPGGSVDANAINSSGGGGVNGPIGGGYVSSPAAAILLGLNGTPTAIKLSPCSYDFDKLIACLARKAAAYAAQGFYIVGNCQAFVENILSDCKSESKGCTVK